MAGGRQINRRLIIGGGVAATLLATTGRAFAETPGAGGKLVVVILRGAMDGLAAMPKFDDPHIREHRASLIDPKATPLTEGFALHSAMPQLASMFAAGEAAFAPAAAGPWRERSHFEAQDLLECGAGAGVRDGWLNRALISAPASFSAVSIGPVQPLILRGAATSVSSWSPPVLPEASDDTIQRLMDLYAGDALLAPALAAAMEADRIAEAMEGRTGGMSAGRGAQGQYVPLLSAAGRFLSQPDGPAIAVVGLDGWDTHAGQNTALNLRFAALDSGLAALRAALGDHWSRTAIVAVSEFGRTVRVNGAGGTDHGTAGLAILAGGAVRGGRMLGDWPTLKPAALYENRDLAPTIDVRAIFKGLMRDHLGWDRSGLDKAVFPGSADVAPIEDLVNRI